mmetsp:Transcript_15260/g.21771  ORF Transcript_15260/g.21771 Transcript_15260/m.21771 type:complete len:326 (-) Transcript_15260:395-1372(-)
MGKKRSKTKKQNMAKAIAAASSTKITKHKTTTNKDVMQDIEMNAQQKEKFRNKLTSPPSTKNLKRRKNNSNNNLKQTTSPHTPNQVQQENDNERKEFEREHASLWERTQNELIKDKNNRKRQQQKRNKKQNKQQILTSASQSGNKNNGYFNFTPATLDPFRSPTVREMVDNAADLMEHGMNDIGRQLETPKVANYRHYNNHNKSLQVMAEQKRREWKMEQENLKEEQHFKTTNNQNSFMALHDNSESEDDENDLSSKNKGHTKPAVSAFSFTPASFSISSANSLQTLKQISNNLLVGGPNTPVNTISSNNTPNSLVGPNDVDPDL